MSRKRIHITFMVVYVPNVIALSARRAHRKFRRHLINKSNVHDEIKAALQRKETKSPNKEIR